MSITKNRRELWRHEIATLVGLKAKTRGAVRDGRDRDAVYDTMKRRSEQRLGSNAAEPVRAVSWAGLDARTVEEPELRIIEAALDTLVGLFGNEQLAEWQRSDLTELRAGWRLAVFGSLDEIDLADELETAENLERYTLEDAKEQATRLILSSATATSIAVDPEAAAVTYADEAAAAADVLVVDDALDRIAVRASCDVYDDAIREGALLLLAGLDAAVTEAEELLALRRDTRVRIAEVLEELLG